MKKKKKEKDEAPKKERITVVAASCTCGWNRSGDDWREIVSASVSHRMLHAMSIKQMERV